MKHGVRGVEAGSIRVTCTASKPEAFAGAAYDARLARRRGRKRLQMCKMWRHMHGVEARSVSICCVRDMEYVASYARRRGQKRFHMLHAGHGMHGVKAGSVCRCVRCGLICTASRPEAFLYGACDTWNARRRGGKHLQICKMWPHMHGVKARIVFICCMRDMECTASRQEASADV